MPQQHTGFIIVGLQPKLVEPSVSRISDLHDLAKAAGAADLLSVLRDQPDLKAERVITSVPAERIRQLEAKAAAAGFPRDRSLASYWRIDTRQARSAEQLLGQLSRSSDVEDSYLELSGSDPLVNPTDDVFAALQLYLDAAPTGIDARWAWTQSNGSGASVGFVDLEQGWTLNHEDLPPLAVLPGVPQDVNPTSAAHGTGVLGIVVGVDNAVGIVGVAPTPAWASIASHYRASDATFGHVADAITALLDSGSLTPGDVLLIEYQDGLNRPIETDPVVWSAIELATALGTVVIEAAGNGNVDLDTVPKLNRLNPLTFKDSRAVIVGGGMSALDATGAAHDRWVHPVVPAIGSNFGSRVDCYAYAENVVTAGPGFTPAGVLGGTGVTNDYRSDFGGTSAAAAIVAGAAVVLQGLHKGVKGTALSPTQMRSALSKHGTPQGAGQPGHIGVMPDLQAAAVRLKLIDSSGTVPSAPTNVRIQP
jgi:serine protease